MAEGILQVAHLTKRYGGLVAVNPVWGLDEILLGGIPSENLIVVHGSGRARLLTAWALEIGPSNSKSQCPRGWHDSKQ